MQIIHSKKDATLNLFKNYEKHEQTDFIIYIQTWTFNTMISSNLH